MKRDSSYITKVLVCASMAGVLLLPAGANAADFLFQFNTTFSGTSPTGSAPWLTEEFQDVTPGKVNLTITTTGLQGTEFASDLYLNINPALTATSLVFTKQSMTGSFTDPTISTGEDAFKADGDGYYDVDLGFSTSHGSTFTVGDSITYQITGISGLVANDFEYTSSPGGGAGTWLAAAHIQSIGDGGASGWEAPLALTPVPEPAPAMLLLTAASLWFGARQLRNRARKA
jgi:hypothetical protein